DADILLVDEVLAVGDASFQQKCFDVFNEMRDSGRTIVFVTHDMGSLNRFCHRALLLEKGEMVHVGEPHEVGERSTTLAQGQRITVKALVNFLVDVEDPAAGLYVLNEDHVALLVASSSVE